MFLLFSGVLIVGGCTHGRYHGGAYYGSQVSADYGYVHYSSGCGNDYGALLVLGIYGVMVLIRAIVECA